ncbi:MAG: hypothetical protein HQL32_16720 [Planctomycetes bacterium]|nr:hypothetical protein [Planctomycetota bacterium]
MKYFFLFFFLSASAQVLLAAEPMTLPNGIKVSFENKEVHAPISVSNKNGQLEFIVSKGLEKDYESVFSTKISAKDIHMAILLIGIEPSAYAEGQKAPQSSQLELFVKFGEEEAQPISHYLKWKDGSDVQGHFYFVGSFFEKISGRSQYMAELSLNIVAAYPDKSMVISPNFNVENPYAEGESVLYPDGKTLPKIGTKGMLIIRKPQKAAK